MGNGTRTIGDEIHAVLLFVGAIWAVYLVSLFLPWIDAWGVIPRTVRGLVGIVTMPFLHASLGHIVSNTVPLIVLLILLAGSRAQSWEIVLGIILLGGGLLWLLGRNGPDDNVVHIGASGLIFGLIAFLIVSGLLERRLVPLLVALLVGFLYGGTMLGGVMPFAAGRGVSWDGHLCGAAAGVLVAFALVRGGNAATSGYEPPRMGERGRISGS